MTIQGTESVTISGVTSTEMPMPSIITTGLPPDLQNLDSSISPENKAGNLFINTQRLNVINGGVISTASINSQGGNLTIQATESVTVEGGLSNENLSRVITGIPKLSQIPAGREFNLNAGTLTLLTPRLTVANGGQISSSSQFGNAGTLTIQAPQSILVTGTTPEGLPSRILAETGGTGKGGNLDITTRSLTVENEGKISTATSELGPEFSGIVTLNTPDIDPTQGLIEFPDTPIDISQLIDQNLCQLSKNSELTATGRQGLPSSPTAEL